MGEKTCNIANLDTRFRNNPAEQRTWDFESPLTLGRCKGKRSCNWLDDQRASVGNLPGLRITPSNLGHLRMDDEAQEPADDFFNMLMKCQSSRLEDQCCAPPHSAPRGPTVPDEDFFSLIQRVQAKRMDEQRVDLASGEEDQAED
ncbi:G-protein-signaling modulator 1-like [Thamnophis elegans]|uniref:G-protein-signaling modulator 1-like n=1 Tax=Thamnophis elegans TaxID=35005 RepID=UPI0013789E45|nr:G-protein-signaling modulator 1-like [Thamnophis elegans]